MPYIGRPIGVPGHTTQKLDDPSSISGNAFTMNVGGVAISPDASSLAIYVDGVRQEAGDAYTVSGSTLTFTGTFTASNHFHGYVMGDAMYVENNSISTAKVQNDAITDAKLAVPNDGAQVFNETGAAVDFRIESDGDTNMFMLDGSANAIGMGVASPDATLHLQSAAPRLIVQHDQSGGGTEPTIAFRVDEGGPGGAIGTIQAWTANDASSNTATLNFQKDGTTGGYFNLYTREAGGSQLQTMQLRSKSGTLSGSTYVTLETAGGTEDGNWLITFNLSASSDSEAGGIANFTSSMDGGYHTFSALNSNNLTWRWDGDNIQVSHNRGDNIPYQCTIMHLL